MRKLCNFFLMIFVLIGGLNFSCLSVYAIENDIVEIEEKWKYSTDNDGNLLMVLDMTDEEIEQMEMNTLRQKYESKISTRDSGTYMTYEKVELVYDSGAAATSYILIGSKESWGQHSSLSYSKNISFSLCAVYKAITGTSSCSLNVTDTYILDNRYDSKLGLFARLTTNKYKVIVKDKYTGAVVSTYYDYVMTRLEMSARPIYDSGNSNQTIFYTYGSNRYNAQMIKKGITKPVTSSTHITTAVRSCF